MPLEMIAGAMIYHNKSSGKNYGLVGYIGTMREQRSAARGEVLLRFGNHANTVSYSHEWVCQNCWVRVDSLSPHRAFNLPQFLRKYEGYAVANVRHITKDLNHAQIKQVVDHATSTQNARKPTAAEKAATPLLATDVLRDWLQSHSTLSPRSLAGYMNLLVGREDLRIAIPDHIAAFHGIDAFCTVPAGAFAAVSGGRITVRATSRANDREIAESVPLAVIVGSMTPAIFLGLHDEAPATLAREWHETCRATIERWPKELCKRDEWYVINDYIPEYKVVKANVTPAGTFSLSVVRRNRNSATGISIGYRVPLTVKAVTELNAPATNLGPFKPDAPTDLDTPRRHLLAVKHDSGELNVVRISQTYRIADNAAKNLLVTSCHDRLVMYVETDDVVHIDNARDLGSDIKLETRKAWKEVQTYERELQITVRKPLS
ncbi:hypothetical protein HOR75_gp48 [Shewanella phage SppYZU05]|uniref:Uncharacterized protein n=1 Tax=Shewanella phage SppYZU05 TaxID=1970795 RepID=A0A1W6JTG6_9CAUD|nr:hypothetical protein HOR75_gp48 [Shewanella phage SppYZU05]ARM70574.1 hypothetical protein SppYZU05_48 [Shewanella phage SppYZU05]